MRAILKDRRGRSSREGAGLLKARLIVATVVAGGLALAVGGTMALAGKPAPDTSKYPDLRTVVPTHLNLVNQQQNEYLRFSNGIANTGGGPWAMRPENELGSAPTTTAWQEIRSSNAQYLCGTQPKANDPCYTVLSEQPVSIFEYHPTHNHWHTADVARFEVRKGTPDRKRRRRQLAQGRLLPPRPVLTRGQRADEPEDVLGLLHQLPGSLRRVGRPVPPVDGRAAGRPDRGPERDRLLPRLHDEPDGRVPGAVEDEQHRVGEVHAFGRLERQPQGDRDGHVPVQQPGAVRRALDEPLTSAGRGRAGDRPAATRLL